MARAKSSGAKSKPKGASSPVHWGNLLWLTVTYVAVVLAWDTLFVYPLRLLVVFLHEISHGIAAILTGGRVIEMQVVAEEGGHCVTQGGNRFITLSAGYLGSLLFGAAILLTATRTRSSQIAAAALGLVLVYTSWRYVPWGQNAFGKLFGIGTGAVLAYLALLPPAFSRAALLVVGLTSCLYAIVDIKSDVIDRSDAYSDASALAEITSVPAYLWGVLWIGISLVVGLLVVKWSVWHPPGDGAPPPGS